MLVLCLEPISLELILFWLFYLSCSLQTELFPSQKASLWGGDCTRSASWRHCPLPLPHGLPSAGGWAAHLLQRLTARVEREGAHLQRYECVHFIRDSSVSLEKQYHIVVCFSALCGGTVKNATVGRVLSPSPHPGPNATQDRSCSWSLEAPKDQRLHLHLERLALGPTDRWQCRPSFVFTWSNTTLHFTGSFMPHRLVLWSGLDAGSVVLFDSGRGGQIPFEGVISEGPAVRIQFITDQPNHNTGFNIRYEGTATINLYPLFVF